MVMITKGGKRLINQRTIIQKTPTNSNEVQLKLIGDFKFDGS